MVGPKILRLLSKTENAPEHTIKSCGFPLTKIGAFCTANATVETILNPYYR